MNFNPNLTTQTAVFLSLFAAFMWGTWFISLKYLGDYPLDGYHLTLFTTSILFVWSVGFMLEGPALLGDIRHVLATDPSRVYATVICGILYVFGMRLSLYVYSTIGLTIAQPIQSSVLILMGTLVSGVVGGVPDGFSVDLVIVACTFLVGAVFASMLAGKYRAGNAAVRQQSNPLQYTASDLWKSLTLVLVSSAFIPAYTFGLSYGLRSTTHPHGLAVLPFMALLSSGAFIGSLIVSGGGLTLNCQWRRVFLAPFSIHKFGIFSGLFHYGGNILHTFATSFLSSVISWPLGVTSGLWTQVWGLVYGEFRGAPRKALLALLSAIFLYLVGAYLIASQL